MLLLPALCLGAFLHGTVAWATAAPAVTPLAVLPRTESAECALLQDESFDSSVSDCFAGFVGTMTTCRYADNEAWIFNEGDAQDLAQGCVCPAYQDIIDQCLVGCPRLFRADLVKQYSDICEGGQTAGATLTRSQATPAVSETRTVTEAVSTLTSASDSTFTGSEGGSETAQESAQASGEPENVGAMLTLPPSLVLGLALIMAVVA